MNGASTVRLAGRQLDRGETGNAVVMAKRTGMND